MVVLKNDGARALAHLVAGDVKKYIDLHREEYQKFLDANLAPPRAPPKKKRRPRLNQK